MTNLELARQYVREHNADARWSPFESDEWRAIEMFATWLDERKSSEPADEPDEPIEYGIEEAIRIAGLWRAGKMIGGDEDGVRDALLAEVERLRLPETKF